MKYHTAAQPRFVPAVALLLILVHTGCERRYASESAPPDEAKQRLDWENDLAKTETSIADAAREYFLPKYYYDPDKPAGQGVPDYFQGMDRIVVSPDWTPDTASGPPVQVPVFQLLDHQPDGSTTAATATGETDRSAESAPVPSTGVATPAPPPPNWPAFRVETDPLFTNQEILGRNTWMLWCGGNEGFWDWLGTDSLGFIDLLKLVDSRNRAKRFETGGLINEPGMMQSGGPDERGIWLDIPIDGAAREWREKYLNQTFAQLEKGQHTSQRGLSTNRPAAYGGGYGAGGTSSGSGGMSYGGGEGGGSGEYADYSYDPRYPPPEIYGISSGVVGLRLFPNPYFDAEAADRWNAERYYNDESYWSDPNLVRPYRVGVTCAYCHASFHPLNPPRDVTNPEWEHISGNIGAQYLRIRHAFGNLLTPDNFAYHLLDSQPPGTIDTSLIASDNINNPNTMNAVFNLTQRAVLSLRLPSEQISAASGTQPSIWDLEQGDKPSEAFLKLLESQGLKDVALNSNSQPERLVPRILLDGSDSIGAWGALARVYLNIGTYWEQWQRLHRTVVGFEQQKAFRITDCDRNSVYWNATQDRVAALRDYFLKVSPGMPLLATADGADRLRPLNEPMLREQAKQQKQDYSLLKAQAQSRSVDVSQLRRGREVFARNCIVCHSSIQPEIWHAEMKRAADLNEFWIHNPLQLLENEEYQQWALAEVEKPEFWQLNFLSCDYRVPITLVGTNSGRAMATNALDQNMWDDFASESYQSLPSVGAIEYFDPYDGPEGKQKAFLPRHRVRNDAQAGGGGPGFYRVPTLVSIWATAPFLHNNSLGKFNNDPSINGRLEAFDDAIRKLLWPARRLESSSYNGATAERLKRDHGLIWRTSQDSYLTISGRRLPTLLGPEVAAVMSISERYPWLRDVRPRGLPGGILFLASFLLLYLDSPKQRRIAGCTFLAAGLLAALLAGLYGDAWRGWVYPLGLVSLLSFLLSGLFLLIDYPQALRWLALAALVLGVVSLVLLGFGYDWDWVEYWQSYVSLSWLSWLLWGAFVFLLFAYLAGHLRRYVGTTLIGVVIGGLVIYLAVDNVAATRMTGNLGNVLVYLLPIVAAAVVLLTPDHRELARYFGYATLLLSLAAVVLVCFFAGELGDIRIGPIPQGTPVNLLANANPDADPHDLLKAIKVTVGVLAEIESKHLNPEQAAQLLRDKVAPALMSINKCPDFVMDHGHYYEWFDQMTDDDKHALIELLKTF